MLRLVLAIAILTLPSLAMADVTGPARVIDGDTKGTQRPRYLLSAVLFGKELTTAPEQVIENKDTPEVTAHSDRELHSCLPTNEGDNDERQYDRRKIPAICN